MATLWHWKREVKRVRLSHVNTDDRVISQNWSLSFQKMALKVCEKCVNSRMTFFFVCQVWKYTILDYKPAIKYAMQAVLTYYSFFYLKNTHTHTHFGIFGGAMTLKTGEIIKTSVLTSFDSN